MRAAGDEVVLPSGVTMEQALAFAEAGQRADGIERIKADGIIVYTDKAVQIVRDVLGHQLMTPLAFDECDEQATELIARFRALLDTQGLPPSSSSLPSETRALPSSAVGHRAGGPRV